MCSGQLCGPLLALLLAQAEPAPPTPADPPPMPQGAASRPGQPPETPPAAAAPPARPTPVPAQGLSERAQMIGIAFGVARRAGAAGGEVPPRHGLAFASQLGRRYWLVDDRVELGFAFHFGFQRYAQDVQSSPGEPRFDDVRTLTYYDLTLLHTAAIVLGRVRPFLALGGGIALGHFSTIEPDFAPGEARATRPVGLGAAGLDVSVIRDETRVGIELAGTYLVQAPSFTSSDGAERSVFGNRLSASVWLRHAF